MCVFVCVLALWGGQVNLTGDRWDVESSILHYWNKCQVTMGGWTEGSMDGWRTSKNNLNITTKSLCALSSLFLPKNNLQNVKSAFSGSVCALTLRNNFAHHLMELVFFFFSFFLFSQEGEKRTALVPPPPSSTFRALVFNCYY